MLNRRRAELTLTSDHKRVVWHLKTNGPMSRSALAAGLDMHNAAITRLIRELLMFGCLDEIEGRQAGRGRPIVPLTLSGRVGYAAGAMAHPGWLELVLVDFAGVVLARHDEPFDSPDPRTFIDLVGRRLREMALAADLMHSRLLGLGVSIPGPVTREGPARRWTVKWLEGWRDVDHPQFFEDALGHPVWVENEATLAGLADFAGCGLMQRHSSAISLFVGHGVGGSVIVRRDILSGEYGNAGDLGRLYPALDQPRPSGIDLLSTINAAGGGPRSLLEIGDHLDRFADVIAAWVARASDQLIDLAASGAAWLDPGAILVTGSLPVPILAAIGERLEAAEWIFGLTPMPRPTFHVSALGSWAVPIGAAMLPIHHLITLDG